METLTFKTPDGDFIRRLASAENKSVSEFIRATFAAMKPKPKPAKIKFKRHPVSGCWVIATPPPRTPTQAELDAALKDYL